MSSWKYAGACVSPKGTLAYSYFPNGEVKAFYGIDDSSSEMCCFPACRSKVEKYFVPLSWAKMSSAFGIGQINFCMILLSAQ